MDVLTFSEKSVSVFFFVVVQTSPWLAFFFIPHQTGQSKRGCAFYYFPSPRCMERSTPKKEIHKKKKNSYFFALQSRSFFCEKK